MAAAGITKRWVRGSLLITVLVILAAEVMFLYTDYRELYGSVQRAAESRFSTIAGRLQATGTAGDANETSESRGQALRRTVEQFDEKDKFEFMLLDAQGVILATSSGTMTRDLTDGTDFLSAQTSASGKGHDIFTTPQGERVMAVTELVPYAAGNVAAMRLVTSLTLVDRQWWNTVTAATGVGVLVLVFTIWSGLFFVRSIVRPLGEIEATATKIAKGDLQVRLPDNRYNDEVGRLCKTINQMAEDLAETERLKNEFISSVSHELRTPLAAIHGYAELYKMQRDMPGALERADESIEHIERSSQRMTVLVEDLLSLARLDEGRGIDMTGTVKLSSLVTDAVDDLHALDPDRAVRRMQISLEPARDLNHPAEFSLAEGDWPEVVLPGDASRLRQVVTNIVGNIHRYTPADSPAEAALGVMPAAIDPRQLARMPASDASMRRFIDAAEVGASMQTGYRYAVLRFVDHGPGVPPESRSKIFERFYTADPSRAREKGGTGLGMAIAQSVVKAHHGFICATGTDGGGLTFTVVLPIEQIAAPEPKQSTGKTKDAKQKTSWFSSERKTQATQPKA